jgi:hypothetical protein
MKLICISQNFKDRRASFGSVTGSLPRSGP